MPEPLIKDTGQIIEKFVEAVKARDGDAIFKMMTNDAQLVDFEGNSLRGAMTKGFFKDWPPRASNMKFERTVITGNAAVVNLVIMGGAYARATQIKIQVILNDQFKIKNLRYTMGPG